MIVPSADLLSKLHFISLSLVILDILVCVSHAGLTSDDYAEYDGDWIRGKREGFGKCTFHNGSTEHY